MIAVPSHGVAADTTVAGYYLHWGVVQISLANLLVIAVMVAVFLAALLVPFPGARSKHSDEERDDEQR
jgi:hypothetical protein